MILLKRALIYGKNLGFTYDELIEGESSYIEFYESEGRATVHFGEKECTAEFEKERFEHTTRVFYSHLYSAVKFLYDLEERNRSVESVESTNSTIGMK